MFDMRRRQFMTLLGGAAAAAWPVTTAAQQKRTIPVIGFLHSASYDTFAQQIVIGFHRGLAEAGYVEGQNVAIEYRWAESKYDRLAALAGELVRREVAVIVANGPSAPVAKLATATIPIVFATGDDPVRLGLVASLNRPGGNVTGVTTLALELGPKRLELLHELLPAVGTIALLVNPSNRARTENVSRDLQAAAHAIGVRMHVMHANTEQEIDSAIATVVRLQVGGLLIGTDPFFNSRIEQLGKLALVHGVPAIYQYRDFAAAGGLMSYGGSITDLYYRVGVNTGRILKGEKPADLPVQQSTKAELIINLKAAKALGVTFPLLLLGRADEVIE
jgi:putative tryptophan/tyrosine transport system substrate-binding protein